MRRLGQGIMASSGKNGAKRHGDEVIECLVALSYRPWLELPEGQSVTDSVGGQLRVLPFDSRAWLSIITHVDG